MKQRDLIFAGLLFMGVPAIAQPTRTAQDAKVIFQQNFEQNWEAWQTTPVDTISQLEYYNVKSEGDKAFSSAWSDARFKDDNLVVRTDSVMVVYNGVMLTDDASDIESNKYGQDEYQIIDEKSQDRKDAFAVYGEDGGDKVFQFISGGRPGVTATSDANKYTDNYRRNLFVRLNKGDIEDTTSFRITFYVKAKPTNDAFSPRLHVGLFRGYFHSEKPFSMGLQSDADNYKYNTEISYTKENFTGKWEKVVYMDYYLNDSIANNYMLSNGYWWSTNWTWKADSEGNTSGQDLVYIKQPDKFFFRMSFQSDSTDFMVDNISLTKSWIGGCEYDKDKMRVDFGYKTNLGALADAAKSKTNIAAVEVPGENLEVWCLKKGEDHKLDESWEDMPMRSAEYHGDGYMYIFTDYFEVGGEEFPFEFEDYDQVLVTFINPTDNPDLALKYTGTGADVANLFPRALDTAWIKAGKIVPNFYNEIATPNPNIFKGVHSMKDLPPVLQAAPFEEGSFFMDPVTSMEFQFSRKILFDDKREASEKVIAYVGDQIWNPSYKEGNDKVLVITQPAGAKALSGDVEVKLIQLYGLGTDQGEEVVLHYNFSKPSRNVAIEQLDVLDFATVGENGSVAAGVITYSGNNYTVGTGLTIEGANNLNRLFVHSGEGSAMKAGYEVRPHSGQVGGHVYLGTDADHKIHLNAGTYSLQFKGVGWSWNNGATKPVTVYVFPYTEEKLSGVAEASKTEIGVYTPTIDLNDGDLQKGDYILPDAENITLAMNIATSGDYIIEFNNKAGAWSQGSFVGDFKLGRSSIVAGPVSALNASVEAANARIALAADSLAIYDGVIYNATVAKAQYYKAGGEFDALLKTKPSEWAAAKKDLDDATKTLKLRMDSVDAFVAQKKAVADKLAATKEDYSGLDVYAALEAVMEQAIAYPVTTKTGPEIYAFNDEMKAAISTLDNRIALNTKFANELARALNLIETAAKPDYEEYATLQSIYDDNKDFNTITSSDADVNATYASVHEAANAYDFRVIASAITTIRNKALVNLAEGLESEITKNETVAAAIAALDDDDDQLADVLKAAVKLAIYQKAAANKADKAIDSIDVTPFIKNYYLYQTPSVIERTDVQVPGGNATAAPGYNMQHSKHAYNSGDLGGKMPIWVMITGQEYTDLYPGWSAQSFQTGNAMVTGDKNYTSYVNGTPVFDAMIGMDWNGKAELKQDLVDLPKGEYTLGVQLLEHTGSGTSFTVNADTTYAIASYKTSGAATLTIDKIMATVCDTVSIDLVLTSGSGWSRADNFTLAFRPAEDVDYATLVADQESKLAELITFAGAAVAEPVRYGFYNLGGMKIDSAKSGEVVIRKTVLSNGKITVDKVLVK